MNLNNYAVECAAANKKWDFDADGKPIEKEYGTSIALMHSELSESLEADRKNLADDKLPQYPGKYVELVDCVIRILHLMGKDGVNVEEIYQAKMYYNAHRFDHTHEGRKETNGKKY